MIIGAVTTLIIGRVARNIGNALDDTTRELNQTLNALKESKEFSQSVIASSNDCINVLDIQGHLLSMSENGQKLLEIDDVSQYLGTSWIDFWKMDKEEARQAVLKAVRGETGQFYGYCETAKGAPKWWEVVVTPIIDADNKIENLLAVSRDITERRRSEKLLEKSAEEYRNLFNNAEVGIFRSRLDGSEILAANRKFLEIVGRTWEETIGKPSAILWADSKEREEMVQRLVADG